MKVNIRRIPSGEYELFDDGSGEVLRTGLTSGEVYNALLLPQLKSTLEAIGRLLAKADREFEQTRASSSDDSSFEVAVQKDLDSLASGEGEDTVPFEEGEEGKGGEKSSPG